MRLIPVLDILNRLVVRGVGGRRNEYRQIVSCLTTSAEPLPVARVLVDAFHPRELYIADLNAIAGDSPELAFYKSLKALGVARWIDAGIRSAASLATLLDADIEGIILGLETLPGQDTLRDCVRIATPERLIFSLDLKQGQMLGNLSSWKVNDPVDPWPILEFVHSCGIRRWIILDLAGVGEGRGVPTLELCRQISQRYSDVEIIAGGGIRGRDDLRELEDAGVAAALVASALHDGTLKGA